jgi:hypothetical protein
MGAVYNRISARIRDGVAVAEARNNSCSACFMALRPQMMAEVRRGDEIIFCDNCNRILYYAPTDQPAHNSNNASTLSALEKRHSLYRRLTRCGPTDANSVGRFFVRRRPAHARVARVLTKTSVRASSRVAAGRFRADFNGGGLTRGFLRT